MVLSAGSRIGVYETIATIGAGGMGEVYRARDTKLDRQVALKVLPDLFADDPERLARFEREAKTLASLNHPNIAQLFGFEDSGGTRALVMELVEGDDLAARLARGPIPLDEALAIARQVADALGAAHDQGIIHRDLKPANIKVREDGTVKVLDFGLAKALDPGGGREPGTVTDHSPTITTPAMTMRGVILGTAAYMSPEQAKGKVVDKRADIWAFGCVLYEMLTGRRAFAGEDVSDTFASVLKGDVDWTPVPPRVLRLLQKCLERDPRRRLHDIGDAWDLIGETPDAVQRPAPARGSWLAWSVAGALLAATAALAVVRFTEAPPEPPPVRFQMLPPAKHIFDTYIVLSPDGRKLAFTARDENGIVTLWVRDLEAFEARRLPGTEGAWSPFWSPDSKSLAFAVDRIMKRVNLAGGSPETLIESDTVVGMGAWNANGVILFGTRGAGALRRVPASGGVPVPVTKVDPERGETFHSFPFFLPDGRHFLYLRQSSKLELMGVYAGDLEAAPDQQSTVRLAATNLGPVCATFATGDSRLLYLSNGVLVAQPFDPGERRVSGESVRLAEQIASSGSFGAFSVSGTGVLAYRTGLATSTVSEQLTWLDRRGQRIGTVGDARPYAAQPGSLALSPDGTRAVVGIAPTPGPDLWLVEFARGIFSRFTFQESPDLNPIWSPDGARIVFRASRLGQGANLFLKDTNGTTDEALFVQTPETESPTDWSRDGRFVLYETAVFSSGDLWVVPVEGSKTPVKLLGTEFREGSGRFSPDGKWIAYISTESGRQEVYLRPFAAGSDGTPSVGAKWQVSNEGGNLPRWRRDAKEIFYRHPSGAMTAVDVTVEGSTIKTGLPHRLFDLDQRTVNWDVTPDGQRFLASISVAPQTADPISVVLNWQAGIGR